MDELELLARSRPEPAPSADTVARHRRQLSEALEGAPEEMYPAADQPGRRARLTAMTAAAVMVAGIAAGMLSPDGEGTTRVVTAPPAAQATTTTTTAPGTVVPCGSHVPAAISAGPYEHDPNDTDPATISVRIYACRLDRALPETLTRPDGHTREMVTTLRELTERFGGLEGHVLDEFGRAHPVSLAPLAGADPDTTVLGLVWSGRPRDAPPIPPGRPQAPPTPQNFDPPWVDPPRR